MSSFNRILLGNNIKILREAMGISQLDFSFLIEISKRTLASIETGTTNISAELLSTISIFFNLSIDQLTSNNLKISNNFRDEIIEFHKDNKAYTSILNKRPNLTFAINYYLLKSDFLNNSKQISDIKLFLEEKKWSYLGTSISNALKREKLKIRIEQHPTKKGTFVYSKIKH